MRLFSSFITSRPGVLTVLPGREEVVSFRPGWSTGHSIKNPDHGLDNGEEEE